MAKLCTFLHALLIVTAKKIPSKQKGIVDLRLTDIQIFFSMNKNMVLIY